MSSQTIEMAARWRDLLPSSNRVGFEELFGEDPFQPLPHPPHTNDLPLPVEADASNRVGYLCSVAKRNAVAAEPFFADARLADAPMPLWEGWTVLATCRTNASQHSMRNLLRVFLMRNDSSGVIAGFGVPEGSVLQATTGNASAGWGTKKSPHPEWEQRSASSRHRIVTEAAWHAHFAPNLVEYLSMCHKDLLRLLEADLDRNAQLVPTAVHERWALIALVLQLPETADPLANTVKVMAGLGEWEPIVTRSQFYGPYVNQRAEAAALLDHLWGSPVGQ